MEDEYAKKQVVLYSFSKVKKEMLYLEIIIGILTLVILILGARVF